MGCGMDDGWPDGWMSRRNEQTNKQEERRVQKDNCGVKRVNGDRIMSVYLKPSRGLPHYSRGGGGGKHLCPNESSALQKLPVPHWSHPVSSTYYALATPTIFPFLKNARFLPASGPLHLLFPLSKYSSQPFLFHPPGLSSNVTSSENPSLTTSSKVVPYLHTPHHISWCYVPFNTV